jgi:hypothetical protein
LLCTPGVTIEPFTVVPRLSNSAGKLGVLIGFSVTTGITKK